MMTGLTIVNSYTDNLCHSSLLTALYCEPPKWVRTDLSRTLTINPNSPYNQYGAGVGLRCMNWKVVFKMGPAGPG